MDEWVTVRLVGGPMDGTEQPVEAAAVYGEDPGVYLIPDNDVKVPTEMPGARAVYEPELGGDPLVWHWHGWVP